MVSIGGLFGDGSIGQQMFVYGVLQQVIGALITPGLVELTNLVNSVAPEVALSPADAASAVARHLADAGHAESEAKKGGVDTDVLATMTKLAQHAPDLALVIAAYHRQIIGKGDVDGSDVSLHGALANAGIPQDWWPVIEQVTVQIPSVPEVMNAWLEGQIDEAEAKRRYLQAGGDPTWFQTSYDANGQAPTPTQALELLNRGIIPLRGSGPKATSYEQAFLEGPWRNKWLESFIALRYYLPPPRTVTAMFREGAFTRDEAASYLAKQGLTPDLIEKYLTAAHTTSTATQKELAKSDVIALYRDHLIGKDDAIKHLQALHYSAEDARYLLAVEDARRQQSQYASGVTRVRTLFLAGKLSRSQASSALSQFGVPAGQIGDVIDAWEVTQQHQVKTLTTSQIIHAWYYNLITPDECLRALQVDGYSPADAWLMMAIVNKGPIKDLPRPGGPVI